MIRRLDLADLPACMALAADRDWQPEEGNWRLLFEVGAVYGIDAPGGGLAATAAGMSFGSVATVVGMVLTAPTHERQGLGRRMTEHAMTEPGTASAFLTATRFGRPLYERMGFRPVGETANLVGDYSGAPSGMSRPASPADLPAVLAADAEATGLPREALLTALMKHAMRVVDGPSGIVAFGVSRPNFDRETLIGPIVAPDTTTACGLLADLGAAADRPVRLDADHRHPEFLAFAGKSGLAHRFDLTLMHHGQVPAARVFALASLALG